MSASRVRQEATNPVETGQPSRAHPNEELIRAGYDAFSRGDLDALREMWDPAIAWHVSGRNPLSGDYKGADSVLGFFGQLAERTGGTFQVVLHDVLANDTHVASLHSNRGERTGRRLDVRVVLTWHVRGGKVVEVWDLTDDQYASDEFWS